MPEGRDRPSGARIERDQLKAGRDREYAARLAAPSAAPVRDAGRRCRTERQHLVARDVARLEQVNRALEKIKEGTYGLSDISGQPIPRERLQAIPETIFTLAEEQAREKKP